MVRVVFLHGWMSELFSIIVKLLFFPSSTLLYYWSIVGYGSSAARMKQMNFREFSLTRFFDVSLSMLNINMSET